MCANSVDDDSPPNVIRKKTELLRSVREIAAAYKTRISCEVSLTLKYEQWTRTIKPVR